MRLPSTNILSRWWCIPRSAIAASVAGRSYSKAGIMDVASPSVYLDTVIFQFCAIPSNYEVYIGNGISLRAIRFCLFTKIVPCLKFCHFFWLWYLPLASLFGNCWDIIPPFFVQMHKYYQIFCWICSLPISLRSIVELKLLQIFSKESYYRSAGDVALFHFFVEILICFKLFSVIFPPPSCF